MKEALPKDTKISKEARECVQECVSEFIAFITCEACEITKEEKRKTINGDDILHAMKQLNFEDYISCVESYNKKYKNAVKSVNAEESLSAGYSLDSEQEWSCVWFLLPDCTNSL